MIAAIRDNELLTANGYLMEHTAFNLFDLTVGLVIVLSALLSFFRGFVREVLSLGAWMGASIITLYAFPHVAKLLGHYIHNPTLASGFAAMLTFMFALIAISIMSGLLLKFVKSGADVGLLDHGMGLMFGLARGVLIVAIGYFIFSLAVNKNETPEWMKGSITRPYVARAAHAVAKLAPSYIDELAGDAKKKAEDLDKRLSEDVKKKSTDSEDGTDALDDVPVKNSTPSSEEKAIDWPDAEALKQRVDDVTKEK
ncbi:MAG: hypothetical protein B7X02_02755 [Rhodospirillales bacterium 12-54-5]|nr:MAG: hypothetical protein B7X02_02755 [Rhodospirillales bacterium 12-54-5]